MNCDRLEMSEDKLANLILLLGLLSQVDVDVVVTVRAGIQHNLSSGGANITRNDHLVSTFGALFLKLMTSKMMGTGDMTFFPTTKWS